MGFHCRQTHTRTRAEQWQKLTKFNPFPINGIRRTAMIFVSNFIRVNHKKKSTRRTRMHGASCVCVDPFADWTGWLIACASYLKRGTEWQLSSSAAATAIVSQTVVTSALWIAGHVSILLRSNKTGHRLTGPPRDAIQKLLRSTFRFIHFFFMFGKLESANRSDCDCWKYFMELHCIHYESHQNLVADRLWILINFLFLAERKPEVAFETEPDGVNSYQHQCIILFLDWVRWCQSNVWRPKTCSSSWHQQIGDFAQLFYFILLLPQYVWEWKREAEGARERENSLKPNQHSSFTTKRNEKQAN